MNTTKKPLNQNKMKQLVYNAVKCLECGQTIVSYHVHDYKTCDCPNAAMVDGGTAYGRYGAKDATRGSRGPNGDQPLSWIAICDMDDDYLKAVIEYGGAEWHINLIKKEYESRNKGDVR
jgi:hypothetical protein